MLDRGTRQQARGQEELKPKREPLYKDRQRQLVQVSTYSNASESDGGTGPPKKLRPVMKGCYTFDFAEAPRQPSQGWLLGGGKFSGGNDPPDILLTEKKKKARVSSRHARLTHNFTSGALIITASDNDNNAVTINGTEVESEPQGLPTLGLHQHLAYTSQKTLPVAQQ